MEWSQWGGQEGTIDGKMATEHKTSTALDAQHAPLQKSIPPHQNRCRRHGSRTSWYLGNGEGKVPAQRRH